MSIRDNLEITMYNNLNGEKIKTFDFYNILNDTQNVMVLMNTEELLLFKELQKNLIAKNDTMLKFRL